MTKKLKIRFVKFERALAMQVLEQVGTFKDTQHVKSLVYPEFGSKCIFLRGKASACDITLGVIRFNGNAERDEYLNNVIKWISEEQFADSRKLKIDGDVYTWEMEVSDER